MKEARHNLAARLTERAATHGGAAALVWRNEVVTFAQLEARVAEMADGFRRRGLGPGDRVLLLHRLSPRLYVSLLAAWRVGAAAALVDPGVGLPGFARRVRRLRPNFVRTGRFPGLLPPRRTRAGGEAVEPVAREDPALLTTTSGTTGTPKGIVRSHGLLAAQLAAIEVSLDLQAGDVEQVTLPVFALANLAAGVTSVLAGRWSGEGALPAVAAQARARGATRCTASPEFFRRALAADAFPWSRVFTGGAPVWPHLLRAADAAAKANAPSDPQAGATLVYGSSEAEPIAELPAERLTEAVLARVRAGEGLPAGLVVPAATLRVADAAGNALPAGAAGELEVAGDHVVPGYLDGVGDAEAKRHLDGRVWHRTGDLGRIDADGLVWLLGRAGEAHLPLAVEAAVMENAAAAGRALTRAALVDAATRRVLFAEGADGELEVAGGHVVPGYLDGVGDAEAKRHLGGRVWHRTGDLGRIDADGLVWLLGRAGEAHLPLAVEAAVMENAAAAGRALTRVALVDAATRRVLFAERADGATPDTLRLWLPPGTDVAEIRLVDRIPVDRRHHAKVDRASLRDMLVSTGGSDAPRR